MSLTEKVLRAKDDLDAVYEAGKQAHYDAFWDVYQQNGTLTNYREAFAGQGWTEEMFKPKYTITAENAERMFCASGIKHIKTDMLDMSKATYAQYMFAESTVEHIGVVDLSNVTVATGVFFYVLNMHTIDKVILRADGGTNCGGVLFQHCPALQNVIIEGTIAESLYMTSCNVLSRDSIESIVNALSTTTSGLTLSLPRVAVENAFGSASEDEGDWYWVMMTKPNWSFALT